MILNVTTDYKRITTGDNSPSLALPPTWEPMHALEGALTETLYIYKPTVEKTFQFVENPVFISVGLGLGYNEILIACESLKQQKPVGEILSYEAVSFLTENFANWLTQKESVLADIYQEILTSFAKIYDLDESQLKSHLLDLWNSGKLKILGRLEESETRAAHGILFDAFSKKTSPELWDENFLDHFFRDATQPICFVSTYACSGVLKRALRKNNFTLNIIKGYAKKKESTFAERG